MTDGKHRCKTHERSERVWFPIVCVVAVVVLFFLNLLFGAVRVPVGEVVSILTGHVSERPTWQYIVINSRLPQAVTAMLCGSALAVSGLMLQTAFRNPLAGPGVFGVSSGASLGVAVVMLLPTILNTPLSILTSSTPSAFNFQLSTLLAAFIGAMLVLVIILAFANMVRSNVMLLIIGIMTGYVASSAISLLNFFATDKGVQSYIIWGMGNFSGVSLQRLPVFATVSVVGIAGSLMLIKPLNALLLGEQYAANLGVNLRRVRNLLLVATGLLTAITTAYCGPVAFIGLAVPHMARLLTGTDNHRTLMPATIAVGAAVALLCNLICVLPGDKGIIPLNAVTPLIGAPVIVYIILSQKGH